MKFYGNIGFIEMVNEGNGIFSEECVERPYYGDTIRKMSRWDSGQKINDDLSINNQISILADPYAYQNFHKLKYVVYGNSKWKVTSVEVQYPRLILSVGGLYNGDEQA